ncbi:MAG: hypothetical protein H6933_08860 [Burkholderiaceae bacterium]|nr:hypothetical protein [Rhodoferax sp.]MCP5284996.1 hypothetical protein [Burkholderiaceae bacterium]
MPASPSTRTLTIALLPPPRLALALAAMTAVAGATAAPVTLRANASVVAYASGGGLLPFGATAGASFYVDYTFESTTPDTPSFPGVGTYYGALTAYRVVMNGVTFNGTMTAFSNFIQVIDDYGNPGFDDYQDAYRVGATDFAWAPGQDAYNLDLWLDNAYNATPVTTGISGTGLPVAPFDVSGFTSRTLAFTRFTQVNGQPLSYSLQGAVTSLELVTGEPPPPAGGPNGVPEPGSLALGLAALACLAVQRRQGLPARG